MCRIAYNPGGITFKQPDLHAWFGLLEKVAGGDGNGVFLCGQNMLIRTLKEIPEEVEIREPFLFHTRKATHGNVKEYNCQPFEGERYVVCHNGIMNFNTKIEKMFMVEDKYSDSYLIHQIIEKLGIIAFWNGFNESSFGVVLVYDKKVKKMYLLKTSGTFEACKLRGNYIYASSNLSYWADTEKSKSLSKGLFLLGVDKITKIHEPPEKKYAYSYGNYGRGQGYSNYNDYNYGKKKKYTPNANKVKNKRKKKKNKNKRTVPKPPEKSIYDKEEPKGITTLFDCSTTSEDERWTCGECREKVTCMHFKTDGGRLCTSCYEKWKKEQRENKKKEEENYVYKCAKCGEEMHDDLWVGSEYDEETQKFTCGSCIGYDEWWNNEYWI